MTELIERLKKEFQDEDYRYAYDEEFSNARMATQIKVLREREESKLTQKELAELAEMKQSRIAALENVNYDAWSISTLRRLARALGVRLFFGFESWGEMLPEVGNFNRKSLEKPSFENDPSFKDNFEIVDVVDLAASMREATGTVTVSESQNTPLVQQPMLVNSRGMLRGLPTNADIHKSIRGGGVTGVIKHSNSTQERKLGARR